MDDAEDRAAVLLESNRVLQDPEATRHLDVLQLSAAFCGAFAVADVLTFVVLRRVLPAGTSWEAQVKIREALVSSLHDLTTIPLVYILLSAISHRNVGPGGLLNIGPIAYIPMEQIDRAGSVLVGFLMWDCAHYLMHARTYAKALVENLVHHVAFLAMAYLNRDSLWCNFAFPLLLMGEWSTLLLNVRIIYRLLGWQEILVSAGFAMTFFVTRIIVFGLLVAHLFSQVRALRNSLARLARLTCCS
jgi:hypothetical protein